MKLISRGAYRLSGTGIVECLEIVDVGCNLKRLDLTDDRSTPPKVMVVVAGLVVASVEAVLVS